ncbi:MAG: aa3-type cytochrome c oxidase subunit IV [Rhodobacteraceae bacterium]|nr:aa3-type cytochrome c oxidase subunit IV [Paracoccaceae bacterium]
MAEYKHGEMDITDHEKTFEGFLRFFVFLFGSAIAILIFLAIFNT